MSEEKCKTCGCTPIAGCGGKGFIRTGENHCKPCPHLQVKRLRQHLGPIISKVQHVKGSPLLTPPHTDLTGTNLRIQIRTWNGLLPHLKWALACKGVTFSFRIITDEEIRTVFVGSRNYRSIPVKLREKVQTYNSIADLVEDPDLVIIQLGILRYKNVAAPSAFYEALRIRERNAKATWIVECDGTDLDSSQVYDSTVGSHVENNYEVVQIETDDEGDDDEDFVFTDHESELDTREPPAEYNANVPEEEESELEPEEEGSQEDEGSEINLGSFLKDKPKWKGRR